MNIFFAPQPGRGPSVRQVDPSDIQLADTHPIDITRYMSAQLDEIQKSTLS